MTWIVLWSACARAPAPMAATPAEPEAGATVRQRVSFCHGLEEPPPDPGGITPFVGRLVEGRTYRAELVWDEEMRGWWTTTPLCVEMNQGVAIRFEDAADLPALADRTAVVPVVFEVVRRNVASFATEERVTVEWVCRIVRAGG